MTTIWSRPAMLGMPAREMVRRDLSAQCDGTETTFATPEPYRSGTLQVKWNGLDCDSEGGEIAETGPSEFEMAEPPETGASLVAVYVPWSGP